MNDCEFVEGQQYVSFSFIDFSKLPHYGWDRQLGHCEQGHRAGADSKQQLRGGQRRKVATYTGVRARGIQKYVLLF